MKRPEQNDRSRRADPGGRKQADDPASQEYQRAGACGRIGDDEARHDKENLNSDEPAPGDVEEFGERNIAADNPRGQNFGAIPTFSTGVADDRKGAWNQGRASAGLHYMTGCGGCSAAAPGAAILGGGCGGRARPRRCRRSFWSTFGSVVRLRISVRPSVVGKWTSSIWMAASLSSTPRGVRLGTIGRSLARSVTCRQ